MNLPNKLTVLRVLLIPFLLFFILFDPRLLGFGERAANGVQSIFFAIALIIFIAAGITDLVDGHLARKHNLITNFGRLMDPLADKLVVTSCFVAFVQLDIFPAWMVVIILLREFLVTGLRSLGTTQGRVIQADRWGKHKTASQMTTIIVTLVLMTVKHALIWAELWGRLIRWSAADVYIDFLLYCLGVICVILTVGSGAMYVEKNWDLVRQS